MLPPMRHYGALACTEWEAPCHFPVRQGAERNLRQMTQKELRKSSERAFQAYGKLLETVTLFKYLGWVLTAGVKDCLAVAGKLRKARKI